MEKINSLLKDNSKVSKLAIKHNAHSKDFSLSIAEKTNVKDGGEKELCDFDHIGSDDGSSAFLGLQIWEKPVPFTSELKLELDEIDNILQGSNIDDVLQKVANYESKKDDTTYLSLNSSFSPRTLSTPHGSPKASQDEKLHETNPKTSNNYAVSPFKISPKHSWKDSKTEDNPGVNNYPLVPNIVSPSSSEPYSSDSDTEKHCTSSTPSIIRPLPETKSRRGRGRGRWHKSTRIPPSSAKETKVENTSDLDFSLSELGSPPQDEDKIDPRIHSLSEEDLKIQPLVKKSRKQYVPPEMKDDKYWDRRHKNNLAARRSRNARRLKENFIMQRAGFLERENSALKDELDKTRALLEAMKKRLANYEAL